MRLVVQLQGEEEWGATVKMPRLPIRTKGKTAAILGCGPAGLFAAHALDRSGWTFDIYSKHARKSQMYGAQYLHEPIPHLTQSLPRQVSYQLRGTATGYCEKVYGNYAVGSVSVDTLAKSHPSWDIREAYDNAWDRYKGFVYDQDITAENFIASRIENRYDLVISTIPAPALCLKPGLHQFRSQKIWAYGDAPDRGQLIPFQCAEQTVICDGTPETGWYRLSNIFGHKTVEYPHRVKPPLSNASEVIKPIAHNCDCLPAWDGKKGTGILRLGRYGKWQKGVLSHESYYETMSVAK